MDHQNIRFHNVEELEPVEGGWLLRRIGAAARARISPGVQENCFATGIELNINPTLLLDNAPFPLRVISLKRVMVYNKELQPFC